MPSSQRKKNKNKSKTKTKLYTRVQCRFQTNKTSLEAGPHLLSFKSESGRDPTHQVQLHQAYHCWIYTNVGILVMAHDQPQNLKMK